MMVSRTRMRVLVSLATVMGVLAVSGIAAHAGQWAQASCENPDGTISSNQGWTPLPSAPNNQVNVGPAPEVGSDVDTLCSPGSPMTTYLSADAPAAVGAAEMLVYTPPAGSTIAGGTLSISGYGGGSGPNANALAVVFSPQTTLDAANVPFECTSAGGCGSFGNTAVTLPANQGGSIYLAAYCSSGTTPTASCSEGAVGGAWAQVNLNSADVLLTNGSVPAGADFTGTVLEPDTAGATNLLFTATDPGGPGVYNVTATVDGSQVYAATPNANNGECVAHGTVPGTSVPVFDYAQPCPQTASVDVPVNVGSLAKGKHELTVTVTDAAGNTATVLDQTITVENPTTTPGHVTPPRRTKKKAVRATVDFLWVWRHTHTQLGKLTFHALPARSSVEITCSGRDCPRNLGKTSRKLTLKTLEKRLYGDTLTAGDKLFITLAHAGETAERVRATINDGTEPTLALLR